MANELVEGFFPESCRGSNAPALQSDATNQNWPQTCFLVHLTPSLAMTLVQNLEMTSYLIANVMFDFPIANFKSLITIFKANFVIIIIFLLISNRLAANVPSSELQQGMTHFLKGVSKCVGASGWHTGCGERWASRGQWPATCDTI